MADHIRRMIFENKLRAGERVPQDEIAADLRVSRVPVREAVIALAGEGWVTSEPHRGAFVNGLDENSTYDHYELLGLLYGFSARRAAERGSDAALTQLGAIHKAMLATEEPDQFFELNNSFLRQLVHMASSRRILALARVMARSIVPGNYFAEIPGTIAIHKRSMRAITKALKAREGEVAEAEFVKMLRQEAKIVVDLLSERGLFGPSTD